MEPIQLNPKLVHNWHKRGASAIETSRGEFDLAKIVDAIQHHGFNQKSVTSQEKALKLLVAATKKYDETYQAALKSPNFKDRSKSMRGRRVKAPFAELYNKLF
ncbi:hypothetical protein QQ045_004829 [Rhodiola kirilowii]